MTTIDRSDGWMDGVGSCRVAAAGCSAGARQWRQAGKQDGKGALSLSSRPRWTLLARTLSSLDSLRPAGSTHGQPVRSMHHICAPPPSGHRVQSVHIQMKAPTEWFGHGAN